MNGSTRSALDAALACPTCRSRLDLDRAAATCSCTGCDLEFTVVNGIPVLLEPATRAELAGDVASWKAGEILPKSVSYATVSRLVSPAVHRAWGEPSRIRALLKGLAPDAVVVDVGTGLAWTDPRISVLNISPTAGVDVVGDAHRLPFGDGSVDGILFHRVIEHLPFPDEAIAEIRRVLKPGGFVSVIAPFLQPYHKSPVDHMRFGRDALRFRFREFGEERLEISAGPTAALLWMLKEWVAIACPGSDWPLFYAAVRETVGWLTYPLLLADVFLRKKRFAHKIACEFWYVGRKKG